MRRKQLTQFAINHGLIMSSNKNYRKWLLLLPQSICLMCALLRPYCDVFVEEEILNGLKIRNNRRNQTWLLKKLLNW